MGMQRKGKWISNLPAPSLGIIDRRRARRLASARLESIDLDRDQVLRPHPPPFPLFFSGGDSWAYEIDDLLRCLGGRACRATIDRKRRVAARPGCWWWRDRISTPAAAFFASSSGAFDTSPQTSGRRALKAPHPQASTHASATFDRARPTPQNALITQSLHPLIDKSGTNAHGTTLKQGGRVQAKPPRRPRRSTTPGAARCSVCPPPHLSASGSTESKLSWGWAWTRCTCRRRPRCGRA